jgi:superfamily II DNA or RNA helicase
LGIKGVFWSEKHLYPEKSDKHEQDLEFIKRCISDDTHRFLMTTSVGFEGIDIPALAGIIPLVGTSYRMVIQPAGRSVRGGALLYVIIYDKHNLVVQKQMNKRLKQIIHEYDNVDDIRTLRITA